MSRANKGRAPSPRPQGPAVFRRALRIQTEATCCSRISTTSRRRRSAWSPAPSPHSASARSRRGSPPGRAPARIRSRVAPAARPASSGLRRRSREAVRRQAARQSEPCPAKQAGAWRRKAASPSRQRAAASRARWRRSARPCRHAAPGSGPDTPECRNRPRPAPMSRTADRRRRQTPR